MGSCYYLGGKTGEPVRPEGKAILEYIKETKGPVNPDEVKQMLPQIANPEAELNSLAKAGFLRKESEENMPKYGFPS